MQIVLMHLKTVREHIIVEYAPIIDRISGIVPANAPYQINGLSKFFKNGTFWRSDIWMT